MKKALLYLIICICTTPTIMAQKTGPVLEHIALYVQDLQKSTWFYQHIIRLDTVPEPFHDGKHTWFTVGNGSFLHVIQGASGVSFHDKNSHLCFRVSSVAAFITVLNKANIPYEDWKGNPQSVTLRVDGVKQIYFKDPDGYWIEINDAK